MADAESRQFRTTQWQIVASAGDGHQQPLADLCQTYWKPLYFYVRRQGYSTTDAQDLIQSFMVHLLQGNLLSSADPTKGRFRTYLVTSLRRFAINQWKQQTAAKRGGKASVIRFDFASAENEIGASPWHDLTAEAVYERKWAIGILQRAIENLECDLAQQGKQELFHLLLPTLTCRSDALPYRDLESPTGMTADALKMTVSRWRQRLGQQIRQQLQDTSDPNADIGADIARLFDAL